MSEELDLIRSQLRDHELRIQALEKLEQETKSFSKPNKKQSIKEFFLEKEPKSDVTRTLTIGFYLEHLEGKQSFNIRDIEEQYRLAKEKVPSNINETVNKNIKKGHIMEEKESKDSYKAWVLTSNGEQFVKNGFKEK